MMMKLSDAPNFSVSEPTESRPQENLSKKFHARRSLEPPTSVHHKGRVMFFQWGPTITNGLIEKSEKNPTKTMQGSQLRTVDLILTC